jgi:hypothetical protein
MAVAIVVSAIGAVGFGFWKLGRSLVAFADEISVFCDADSGEPLPDARDTQPTKRELAISA